MGLRAGDTLTLTRRAVVHLSRYDALKPSVTLTRQLQDPVESDRREMEQILYVELCRAVLHEVRVRDEAAAKMGEELRITPLLKHCEEVVDGGYEGTLALDPDDFRRVLAERPEEGGKTEGRRSKVTRRKAKSKASVRRKAARRKNPT